MHNSIPVITIDGPSGSGKGTISQLLAKRLGWHYLDSGAIYRLLAYVSQSKGVSTNDTNALVQIADGLSPEYMEDDQGFLLSSYQGKIIDPILRDEACGKRASEIASNMQVRASLLACQQRMRSEPGLVADGRDMGTIVFPDAKLKIFLTASAMERAKRRHKQLKLKGFEISIDLLFEGIVARDEKDTSRATAPLKPADDAIHVDATDMSIDQVLTIIANHADEKFT